MDLRKDPITRSWVITGQTAEQDPLESRVAPCRFCAPDGAGLQVVGSMPPVEQPSQLPWSARAIVHPNPVFRIEGDPLREGDGIYDKMRPVGAHELLLENARHDRHLWQASDAEVESFLTLAAQRIQDLKRDVRFKHVTVLKNHGAAAGQDFAHPSSQLTANTFVPRRVLHELRACKDYFTRNERCVYCDILDQEQRQEQRIVEVLGDMVAGCPYAPRTPYEVWILPRTHSASFESYLLNRPGAARELAQILRRTLVRIRTVTENFHMVIHTHPNTTHRSPVLRYWETIDEDYHWHLEILPIITGRAKAYVFKEVYFSSVTPEDAAAKLRAVEISG